MLLYRLSSFRYNNLETLLSVLHPEGIVSSKSVPLCKTPVSDEFGFRKEPEMGHVTMWGCAASGHSGSMARVTFRVL